MILKIMNGNNFPVNDLGDLDLGDLDLCRGEPKIYMELALTKCNHHMKFEVSTINGF